MGWTRDKTEHARRLAICADCPHAVLTVAGSCDTCRRPQIVTGQEDGALRCKRHACGGSVRGKEIVRCGACGCPLSTRVYSRCPKGRW